MSGPPQNVPEGESRSPAELEADYRLERELADRLRRASPEERPALYSAVYDEYFRRSHLPRDPLERDRVLPLEEQLLVRFLDPATRLLEIGAGDGALAARLAGRVGTVVAQDASGEALDPKSLPANCRCLIGDATRIELEPETVDVAYSCHFIEHLHPEDARTHVRSVRKVLARGGVSVTVTPSRHWGPHDVSGYFGDSPVGFHLREYDHADLADLFLEAGFARVRVLRGFGGRARLGSVWPYRFLRRLLDACPTRLRRGLLGGLSPGRRRPFRRFEQVAIAAWK